VRIDKYLWAVRVFRTRSMATNACKEGKVKLKEVKVKPAQEVKVGDIIEVKKLPIWQTYRVKGLLPKRVGAKLAVDFVEDITTDEEMEKLKMIQAQQSYYREKGQGRPTKKDRRLIDKYKM
jgi:ribosome-associated heat shock protein Hsp15